MPLNDLDKKRALQKLGQRAINYYVDTGFCVFCDADDCCRIAHEDHCNVGELSGIEVDEKRREEKAMQRRQFDDLFLLKSLG